MTKKENKLEIPKRWREDPVKLGEELLTAWALVRSLKNQVDGLTKMKTLLVKEREEFKTKLSTEQKAHNEDVKNFTTQSATRENLISRLTEKTDNAHRYENKLRSEVAKLEEVSKNYRGKLKNGTPNTIKNCLNELSKKLGQLELKETYELIHEGFWQLIKLLEEVENNSTTASALVKIKELKPNTSLDELTKVH